jgi:transposase InsO family protein
MSDQEFALTLQSAGLMAPTLDRAVRRARIRDLSVRLAVSEATIYRRLERLRNGEPQRRGNGAKGKCRALPPEVQVAARAMIVSKRWQSVSTALLLEQLRHQFPAETISLSALRRLRQSTLAEVSRYARAYCAVEVAAPNDQWQIDSSIGDFFCSPEATLSSPKGPFRPQLTVCEDAHTRSIMYARYAVATPSTEIATILFQAIRRQSDVWPQAGVPAELLVDWGKVYMSDHLEAALENLGIRRHASHPYYPQDKGKVERAIGTLHHGVEPLFPGYCSNNNQGDLRVDPARDFRQVGEHFVDKRDGRRLLTLPEANALLWQWIAGTYHHQVNRTMGLTPLQSWQMSAPRPHTFSEAYLEQSLLPRAYRKVARGRINCHGLTYTHDTLLRCHGLTVEVRFDPADVREVFIYHEGQRLCVAAQDNPLLAGTQLAADELVRRRQENRAVAAEKRALLDDLLANPAARADLTERIREADANAPAIAAAAPEEVLPTGVPGLTPGDAAEMSDLEIGGLRLFRPRAVNE